MRIKKILPFILLVFLFISCEKEDFEIETDHSAQTVPLVSLK